MKNGKRVYMLSSENRDVKGSISVYDKTLTVIFDGAEDGQYDIFADSSIIAQAKAKANGRVIKKAELNDEAEVIRIKKDGKTIAWTELEKEGMKQADAETESNEVGTAAYIERQEESLPEEVEIKEIKKETMDMPKAEYGFSSDFSTIIKRFKEQMERLEEAKIITNEDKGYIENMEKRAAVLPFDDGWERIYPDHLWRLPIKDIYFPSNVFCIFGQKKYKHLVLKEMSDRYRVGVPDEYKKANAASASSCGFFSFMPIGGGEAKDGEKGYWLADILKN